MANDLKGKKILIIIAPDNFNDREYSRPKEILGGEGAKITVANSTGQPARGMYGSIVKPDKNFYDVDSKDFDAVIFVGGSGTTVYFDNQRALQLAREFYNQGKLVAAICIAPSILANAGILNGKKATAFPSERNNINAVATYTGSKVETDGKIITGYGPEAASEFGQKILEALIQ